jgi:hypothetical protein
MIKIFEKLSQRRNDELIELINKENDSLIKEKYDYIVLEYLANEVKKKKGIDKNITNFFKNYEKELITIKNEKKEFIKKYPYYVETSPESFVRTGMCDLRREGYIYDSAY